MARIILKEAKSSKELSLRDGSEIRASCEELGVPFGCRSGLCGSCLIEVLEGEKNLFSKNQEETEMDLKDGERLACQCRIKSGELVIKIDN